MVIAAKGQSSLEETLSECRGNSAETEDPLYGCQWHLKNTGQFIYSGKEITAGEDINIEGVWNEDVYGTGINVAIVSDGIDLSHEDLSANVRSGPNYDLSGRNSSEENSSEKDNSERDDHSDGSSFTGTRAAGVIAAAGYNGLGVRGTAPGASIYSYRLSDDLREADAVVRNKEITAVSVNGLGSEDGAFFQEASTSWEEGVELGISKGFYGKGVFYVRGAGDGHENNDQANFSEYSNYYGVTSVCSTDGFGKKSIFSEEGVNLWVCAPGSDIVTTDNNNDYVVTSGTFLSASQVGGVAALLREVNGQLSWRDIKLILAGSARQNDFSDMSWETGTVKYGSDTERYNYNPKYGFGVVDAEAAAELAKSWKGVGEMRTVTAFSDKEITIPDGEGNGEGEADGVLVSRLIIPDLEEIFTEFVEVELVFSHDRLQDLDIKITSPSGTVSELVREFSGEEEDAEISYLRRTHRFGSAKHLGEDPSGEWVLKISDTASGDEEDGENTVTLHSWSIKVYGNFYQGPGSEISAKHHDLSFGGATVDEQVYVVRSIAGLPVTLPEATRGTAPYTYSLTPRLPSGLNFNSNDRQINGLPTSVKSKTEYTYKVTDNDGDMDNLTFGITVEANTVPSFTSGEMIDNLVYTVGVQITPVTLPEATGGNGALRYLLSLLPLGLNFDPDTRVISGTPTRASIRHMLYTVLDIDGSSAQLEFRIRITVAEPNTEPTFGSETIDNKVYINGITAVNETLPEATSGNAPLTYSLTPALPAGLDFTPATQVISGTPTTATSETDYTYTVTDADNDTDELEFSITVEEDSMPEIDGSTIPAQMEYRAGGAPLRFPEATGGNAPVTYSITPELPAGLRFNEVTREISGTPRSALTGTYMYTVTDRNGDTDEVSFMLSVIPGTSGTDAGGGGGCAISDQSSVVSDLLGAVVCLMLIPVSVMIRRKRRAQIKT